MKLYIVRHGETLWNTERRLQGRSNIDLNEFGVSLAVKTGIGLADVRFDKVYASPLNRAYQTAELILAQNNTCKDMEIIKEDRIIEMAFGEYEGLCCSKEGWNMPDGFKSYFENCGDYRAPEGGEEFSEVMDRVGIFLNELLADESLQEKNVLLVSHGATIRGIINVITGNSIETYWKGGVHKNCAVTIANVQENKFIIEAENIVYYDDEVKDWYSDSK